MENSLSVTLPSAKHSQKKIFFTEWSCSITNVRKSTWKPNLGLENVVTISLNDSPARWIAYIYTHKLSMPVELGTEANWVRTAHISADGLSLQNQPNWFKLPSGNNPWEYSLVQNCAWELCGESGSYSRPTSHTHNGMGDGVPVPGTLPGIQRNSLLLMQLHQ